MKKNRQFGVGFSPVLRRFALAFAPVLKYNLCRSGGDCKTIGRQPIMEAFFVVLLFAMLILVGYARVQQGVVKTTGSIWLEDEE